VTGGFNKNQTTEVKMLKYMNTDGGAKEEGFTFEDNDCAVRAIALATHSSYTRAHMFLNYKVGRKVGHGVALQDLLQLNAVMMGNKEFIFHPITFPKQYHIWTHCTASDDETAVLEFIDHHQVGAWMLVVPEHIFAVVNGVLMDNIPPKLTAEVLELKARSEPVWYAIEVKDHAQASI
jgi:hypothetical protein